jgi:tetratricopeptide (TPR) repeat protein
MKNTTLKFLGLGLAAAVVFSPVARGQMGQQDTSPRTQGMGGMAPNLVVGQQSTQGAAQSQTPPGQTATPPPVDPAEEAAFKAISTKADDPKKVIADTKDFLTKYPNSRYNSMVYYRQASAYLQLQDAKDAGVAAQKSIDLNRANADALPLIAYLIARQIDNGPNAQKEIQAAEQYAHDAIQLLNALQKPADMSDADFEAQRKEKLSMAHSALGLAYLNEGKNAEGAQALAEAIRLSATPDPVDQYLLGVAYENTKQYSQAVTAYEACSKDPSIGDRCRTGLKETKDKAAHQ